MVCNPLPAWGGEVKNIRKVLAGRGGEFRNFYFGGGIKLLGGEGGRGNFVAGGGGGELKRFAPFSYLNH